MRLPNNRAFLVTIAACFVWGAAVLFAPVDALNYVLRFAIGVGAALAFWRYMPAAWKVYREGARDNEDSLIIAIPVICGALFYYAVYSLLSRALDTPDWLSDSPWSAFSPFLLLTAFILFSVAARKPSERPSMVTTFVVGVGTAVGLFAATAGHFLIVKVAALVLVILRLFPH